MKTTINLDGHFIPLNETAILDKATGIEKFLINTDLTLENQQVVELKVEGKTRRAMIWNRVASKDYDPALFGGVEVKKGDDTTWLHLFPEPKKTKFDNTMKATPIA